MRCVNACPALVDWVQELAVVLAIPSLRESLQKADLQSVHKFRMLTRKHGVVFREYYPTIIGRHSSSCDLAIPQEID